jgi:hypothetical protein
MLTIRVATRSPCGPTRWIARESATWDAGESSKPTTTQGWGVAGAGAALMLAIGV